MKPLQVLTIILSFGAGVISGGVYISEEAEKDNRELRRTLEKAVNELKLTMEVAIENHIKLGPHAGVPAALAVLNEQVMENGKKTERNGKRIDGLRKDIKNGIRDRYYRADAIRDREYLCTLNPELTCPPVPE